MALTLIIVRHGDTFAPGEVPRRIGARSDPPLTAAGEAQARALGVAFRHVRFDRLLASPLQRARRTAELIAAALPQPPAVESSDLLAEIDHGPDEDQPESAVLARIGADAIDVWDRLGVAPADWRVDAADRIARWRRLYATGDGHWLLATSSGAARFALLADPALAKAAADLPSLKLRTGSWGEIRIDSGVADLVGWDIRP